MMNSQETKHSYVVGIVIPCYRESLNISVVFERIRQVLAHEKFEIYFIDDGSDDDTLEKIKQCAARDDRVRYISFSKNFGHQMALKAGFDLVDSDCIVTIDADLEHPVELLPKMIERWRSGFDVVATKRVDPETISFTKRMTSILFYFLFNLISRVRIEEGSADFRLLDKKVVNLCRKINKRDYFWRGIIPKLGFKTDVLSFQRGKRVNGVSQYSFKKMLRLSLAGITGSSDVDSFLSWLYVCLGMASLGGAGLVGISLKTGGQVTTDGLERYGSGLFVFGVCLLILGLTRVVRVLRTSKLPLYTVAESSALCRQSLDSQVEQSLKEVA